MSNVGSSQPEPSAPAHTLPPSPDFAVATCPSCGRHVRVERKRLKPGRFRLQCGGCHKPFALSVDERLDMTASPLITAPTASGNDDELPPALAATLGLTGGPTLRPTPAPRRVRPPKQAVPPAADRVTLAPGESAAGLSGSHAALGHDGTGGLDTYDATLPPDDALGTRSPESSGRFHTPPSHAGPVLPPPAASPGDRLGGYELTKKLGEGGMGAVYLARQVSLDRNVALKVLSPKLSSLPALVGRFMREAYAAGQLVHHNVVQIYDFGKDKPRRVKPAGGAEPSGDGIAPDVHFFSMEFVDGASLQDMVKDRGRLEPKEAASLVLQAARGLAFAHEHGIIHRDVKPDNLMVNRHGVVKVADLGLVKHLGLPEPAHDQPELDADLIAPPLSASISAAASAHLTQAAAIMGTPAYMPPEQAIDAKSCDHTADIYSLGCTLYHLLVGRPPFGGKTLKDVLDGHARRPLEFPDPAIGGPKLASRLRDIVIRMCAKSPGERFRSMGRVVEHLEGYLADKHQATTEPDEQQVKTLRWAAEQFNESGWFRARPLILVGFLAVVLAAMGGVWLAATTGATSDDALVTPLTAFGAIGGLIGMVVLSFAFAFALGGARRRDVLFVKARQLVFGAGPLDWLVAILAVGLLVVALTSFNWHWWWLGSAVLAFGCAWLWTSIVDGGVRADQQPMVARAERVLRELREGGFDEAKVRATVAESAGRRWEAFYEALFGYEAKLDGRRSFGVDEKGREKPRFAAWRDPILAWLTDRLEKRRLTRDRQFLKSLHKNELIAQGVTAEAADKQAGNQATRDVGKAALMREQILAELRLELRREARQEEKPADAARAEADSDDESEEAKERKLRRKKIKYTDDDFERIHESYFKRRFGTPLDLVLGQSVRFAIAAGLIVCFALWFNQNQEAIFGTTAERIDTTATGGSVPAIALTAGETGPRELAIFGPTQPLSLGGLPTGLTRWLSGYHVGIAGLMLAASAFFYGRTLAVASLLATAIVVLVPPLVPAWWWVGVAAGAALCFGAIFFLRVSED